MNAPPPWRASVLTLFPEVFPGVLAASVIGRGLAEGAWALEAIDIRNFAADKHRTVDDTPAGGGAGLVMRPDVIAAALDSLPQDGRPRLYLSPRGKPISQAMVRAWAAGPGVVLLCGRFEGVDDRVIQARALDEVCVGDVVLAGGEAAAQLLLEACVRLLPGVLGNEASLSQESFEDGLLEHPQYTRPRSWEGYEIPEILLSGDHAKVDAWRRAERERLTRLRRPDLWTAFQGKKRP